MGDVNLGTASIGFKADTSGLSSGLNMATKLLGGFGGLAAGALLGAGAAIVGIGVKSVKMAGDFQESMTQLVTGAGESKANLAMVSRGILSMASETGTATQDLSAGMYMIESAGYHGAQGLNVLQAAAEGAQVGAASLADVANGVTTAMTDYASSNLTAAQATNDLIATVASGKTHMGDLARSFSNILPVAAAVHAKFYDVSAALATMTGEGTSAQLASTYLKQILLALTVPAKAATAALASIGLTTKQVSADMQKSLPDTLQLITDKLKTKFPEGSAAYVAAIKAISGGSKNMMAMLELTGSHMDTFRSNLASITDAVNKGGNAITGWSEIQGNFNFKMNQAKEAVNTLMIGIGSKLLPVLSSLVGMATPIITTFSGWIDKSNILSDAVGQIEDAFQKVFDPVKQLKAAAAPLLDTFDRATSIFRGTYVAASPLLDTFDRGTDILKKTDTATKPLLDTFDRATALFPKTTDAVKKTTGAINPWIPLFQSLKPIVEDIATDLGGIVKTIETLAKDGATFAIGIGQAADKSGAFKAVLKLIHDLLPDVDGFLLNVGNDINHNLLPPLETLVYNVGKAVTNFSNWLDKSGLAKQALADLSGAVGTASYDIGTLIGWVSSLVGWLGGGGAGTDTLVVAIGLVGAAFLALKIADIGAQFGQFFNKINDGNGIIGNLADALKNKLSSSFDDFLSKQAPNFKKSLDDMKTKANDATKAEEGMGTQATASATEVETASASEKAALGETATAADEAKISVEGIGPAAEASAGEMGTASTLMETDMKEVGLSAEGAALQVDGVGTAATTATEEASAMVTSVEGDAGIAKGAIGGLSGMLGGLLNLINIGEQSISQQGNGQWITDPYSGTKFKVQHHTGFASGTSNAPGGWSMVGEEGPELMYVPQGAQIYPHGGYPSASSLAGGGGNDGTQTINLYLDSTLLASVIGSKQAQLVQVRQGIRQW